MGYAVSKYRVSEENIGILLRCTNINVKIIACLQASNGLSEDQVSKLVTAKALRKQCQLLYGWMKNSRDLYKCFVKVMEENEQLHVANFLKGKNDEPHVPLSITRYERLIRIKPKLMDSIHYSEALLSSLEAKRAISETDCQDVRVDVLTDYKRNWILINSIQRRSNYSFICFEESLRETHQSHVADYLHEGEVVAVHVNTNHPELDNPLSQLLNETTVKGFDAEPELSEMRSYLVSSKPGKSIIIFLYCKTVEDMALLTEAFNSGRLESIIKRCLNCLMFTLPNNPKDSLEVRLSLDDEEVLLIEEFTGIDNWIPDRFHSGTCVNSDDRVPIDELDYDIYRRLYELRTDFEFDPRESCESGSECTELMRLQY